MTKYPNELIELIEVDSIGVVYLSERDRLDAHRRVRAIKRERDWAIQEMIACGESDELVTDSFKAVAISANTRIARLRTALARQVQFKVVNQG